MDGHEMLPGLKWYGHGITCGVMYGLLWMMIAMEGGALPTIADVYHVQGEVMINVVRYEDPMVYF